jgi:hypothetical protein
MRRRPLGDKPMTNAERQARHRAARAGARPVIHYRRAADRRSRAQRWRDAVAELVALQAAYRAWFEALPDSPSLAGHRRSRPRRPRSDRAAQGLRPGLAIATPREELENRTEGALGPFKEWVGTLAGEASYASATAPDEQRSVKFQTFVYLGNENRYGIPKPVTFQYQVALEADDRSYKKIVPISQELKAGDTDRFTLKIAVPQSSSHRFSLKVRDVLGEELQSGPVSLECFVPRSVRTTFRPGK